jgi:hypothetical protein
MRRTSGEAIPVDIRSTQEILMTFDLTRRPRIIHASRRTMGRALASACLAAFVVVSGASAAGPGVATLETPVPAGASPAAQPGASQTPTDPREAMLAFVQCLRDHGVDMPDPQFTADGGMVVQSGDASGPKPGTGPTTKGGPGDPKVQAAQEACHALLPAGAGAPDPAQQAEEQDKALAFAKCMRDHGIDMPDPQFTADGGILQVIDGTRGDEADMEAASTACQAFAPGPPGGGLDGIAAGPDDVGPQATP